MSDPATPPEADAPSGRSADSLPQTPPKGDGVAEDGRSDDPLEGDAKVKEGEKGEGI